MAVRLIDLSVALRNDPSKRMEAEITYIDHVASATALGPKFGLDPAELPDGRFAAAEVVKAFSHAATHFDAPYHFSPTSEGRPAKTIDEIPLEWCYGNGVVLDLTHKRRGEGIIVEDVQQALGRIGYTIQPGDIVLIRTDVTTRYYTEPGFEARHPGMTRDATLWLIDQGVKVMGIDAGGFDRPFVDMVTDFKAGRKEQLWQAHLAGRDREYCHVENLANLDQIPKPFGFKVVLFPVKIERASAGWVRAVAIVEE